jgi:hypothetical protein
VTPEDPGTEELRAEQVRRFEREKREAEQAADEPEAAQHERRSERAGYLAEKLEERAASERGS